MQKHIHPRGLVMPASSNTIGRRVIGAAWQSFDVDPGFWGSGIAHPPSMSGLWMFYDNHWEPTRLNRVLLKSAHTQMAVSVDNAR